MHWGFIIVQSSDAGDRIGVPVNAWKTWDLRCSSVRFGFPAGRASLPHSRPQAGQVFHGERPREGSPKAPRVAWTKEQATSPPSRSGLPAGWMPLFVGITPLEIGVLREAVSQAGFLGADVGTGVGTGEGCHPIPIPAPSALWFQEDPIRRGGGNCPSDTRSRAMFQLTLFAGLPAQSRPYGINSHSSGTWGIPFTRRGILRSRQCQS